ncbi:MAG: hypothetical protein HYT94_02530 [Parcubacteria group bacterium]|nr:hypothetical protein [Parcubacteria group bacterium]
MFQIRTIHKEDKKRGDYTVVLASRAKRSGIFYLEVQPPSKAPSAAPEKSRSSRSPYGIFSRTSAALLVGFFLFNPFLDVYADELPLADFPDPAIIAAEEEAAPPEITPVAEEIVATSTEEIFLVPQEEASTTEAVSETEEPDTVPVDIKIETALATTTDEAVLIADADTVLATSTDENVSEEESMDIAEEASSTPAITEAIAETVSETSAETAPEEPETNEEEADASNTDNTKPEQAAPPVVQIQTTNVVEHKYLFREHECTRLDDGGFYCAPPAANTGTTSNALLPRAYVESGAKNGGSKEIFFEDANGKMRITDNTADDDAPSYDKQSGLIVWHSLVKGRYQIMLYDISGSTTRQITSAEYNNTDPKVRGKSVVWQGWLNNNWEIFYVKDIAADPPLIRQISVNEQPDMFPQLSDNFVTWQSFTEGSWHVFVYNTQNGEISKISQPEAGKYENPRFALLFENRKENGEVETVGYDVLTGKEIPINSPHRASSELPEQKEKDQAVPVPSGQTGTSTSSLKNPGKDDEGRES